MNMYVYINHEAVSLSYASYVLGISEDELVSNNCAFKEGETSNINFTNY